ncbi:hypothetical protein A3D00_01380 [Candidatus Woesebacteria bacterium RIFCSPHIGHO2_02_FULL_38_9]|uniref:Uncharacterized protein n=1 Tax=Candidatus Roizmanbacteria bacterium RIFCSPHIGHO2_12_FULL_44_10 TaxID=1802054 RepID=A0A1F7I521_9BACT|nr:MAG: hypothetical protein A3F34_00165 [Candidatus Roizmanbacteria bacterium RIFCSPHIGHO2_12_FULL_44_10]OGM31368.1 MAG: hypothetical protein A3D00_01380 [Candidatus Woesebacteria bacterium RIFCSPHIGHO2_02_FULL_38_9]
MRYEAQIGSLEETYPPKLRFSNCLFVSEDLALRVLQSHPGCSVTTARTKQTGAGKAIRETNHCVAIIKETDGKIIALDATRPTYESEPEEDYWRFTADTEAELLLALSRHYGGDWSIDEDKWLHEVPDWYTN